MTNSSLFSRRADLVFVFFLLIQLWHGWNDVLFSSLSGSFLSYTGSDVVYVMLSDCGLIHFINHHYTIGIGLDFLLFVLPVGGLLSIGKHPWMLALAVLYTLYFFYFNAVSGHHYHSSILLLAVLYSFVLGEKIQGAAWRFARYYGLFFMASAALWKWCRGNIFYDDQMLHILQSQLANNLWDYPDSFRRVYFSGGSSYLPFLLLAAASIQLFFLIGFFSKRLDDALFVLFVAFMLLNWLLMDIISLELWIWLFTLYPVGLKQLMPVGVGKCLFPE